MCDTGGGYRCHWPLKAAEAPPCSLWAPGDAFTSPPLRFTLYLLLGHCLGPACAGGQYFPLSARPGGLEVSACLCARKPRVTTSGRLSADRQPLSDCRLSGAVQAKRLRPLSCFQGRGCDVLIGVLVLALRLVNLWEGTQRGSDVGLCNSGRLPRTLQLNRQLAS